MTVSFNTNQLETISISDELEKPIINDINKKNIFTPSDKLLSIPPLKILADFSKVSPKKAIEGYKVSKRGNILNEKFNRYVTTNYTAKLLTKSGCPHIIELTKFKNKHGELKNPVTLYLQESQPLGSGGQNNVLLYLPLGHDAEASKKFAVKFSKENFSDKDHCDAIQAERNCGKIHTKEKSPYIDKPALSYLSKGLILKSIRGTPCIRIFKAANGSLTQIIKSMTENDKRIMLFQLSKGLEHAQSPEVNMFLGDIKIDNVLYKIKKVKPNANENTGQKYSITFYHMDFNAINLNKTNVLRSGFAKTLTHQSSSDKLTAKKLSKNKDTATDEGVTFSKNKDIYSLGHLFLEVILETTDHLSYMDTKTIVEDGIIDPVDAVKETTYLVLNKKKLYELIEKKKDICGPFKEDIELIIQMMDEDYKKRPSMETVTKFFMDRLPNVGA